ncbi:MAG: response regulator [Candidatus Scalindua sp.]
MTPIIKEIMMQEEIIHNQKSESIAVLERSIDHDFSKGVKKVTCNKGKILVMDGDETIRDTVKLVLRRSKYEVETAKDGNEAIELYKRAVETHKPFDAVIMELIVSVGMGGVEAIKRLLEIDSEVKVIVSSGNVDDPILKNFEEYGFSAFLLKPFKIDSLRKTLHEVTMGNMNSGVVSWYSKDN